MGRTRWRADETPMTADIEPRSIDLAQEPAFKLAGLEVHPATLEAIAGDRREQLEPRVMQVLVALARRRGEVVSRDELNELCWGGRVVGDDAVNRCIGRLRKLAQAYGGFTVETVPRVGYRLTEATDRPWRRILRGRRALAALVALAIVLALGAGLWAWRARQSIEDAAEPRIALMPFQPVGVDAESRAFPFAAHLTDSVAGVLSENLPGVAVTGPGERRRPPMIRVEGVVTGGDGGWRVRASLKDGRSGVTLWTSEFTAPPSNEDALRDQVAVATTQAIYNALEPYEQKGLRLDPRSVALYIKAVEGNQTRLGGSRSETVRTFEELVAREPRLTTARAELAIALWTSSQQSPPDQREAFVRRARQEAERAIQMDPRGAGAAFDTLAMLELAGPKPDLVKAEGILLEGIRKSNFAYLHVRECILLINVGRASDAVSYCERALAIRPLAPQLGHIYARALYAAGDVEGARTAISKFARFHPRSVPTTVARFDIAVFGGPPQEAEALLQDETRRLPFAPEAKAALRMFLKARATKSPADIDRAVEALRKVTRTGQLDPYYLVQGAALLGRREDAFAAFDGQAADSSLYRYARAYLVSTPTLALRTDPRFWRIAADGGLIRYWKVRNRWPDFCTAPATAMDCPRAAEQALSSVASSG